MPYVCEHAAGTRWFVTRTYHGALRPKDVAKSEAVRLGHQALLCMNDGCSPDRKYGSYPTWDDARRRVSAFYDPQARHAFEIIRHGRPCKPYGDIETKTAPFPPVPDLVRHFNDAILRIFDEDYGSPITAHDILWTH